MDDEEDLELLGPEALYEQIAARLRKKIKDGTFAPRRAIPSQAEICKLYGVSAPTARAAVKILKDEGLVAARVGKGTYVLDQAASPSDED